MTREEKSRSIQEQLAPIPDHLRRNFIIEFWVEIPVDGLPVLTVNGQRYTYRSPRAFRYDVARVRKAWRAFEPLKFTPTKPSQLRRKR